MKLRSTNRRADDHRLLPEARASKLILHMSQKNPRSATIMKTLIIIHALAELLLEVIGHHYYSGKVQKLQGQGLKCDQRRSQTVSWSRPC